MTDIKHKLSTNNLIITKADKVKTVVILTQDEYKQKVYNFIHNNKFTATNNNPTQHYQKIINQTLKESNNSIQKDTIWRYTNMNPASPSLHATIKLHKPNMPIRPVINWRNEPSYELAKHLTKTLHNHLHLPYTYNIQNSTERRTKYHRNKQRHKNMLI
jgi:hypothetical protein